ncbi:VCBS domain-containing protein [Sulfurimonas sp. MAG313]|nr:VCBS domain-containing protein [Sulfurimonas sp. MAG313]MDF1881670.1 VCBS domain-containing protein [Sulfurimonas sp. MAG313]
MNESLSTLSGNVLSFNNDELHISSSVVKSKYGKCSFTSDGGYQYVLNLRKVKKLALDEMYEDKVNYGLKDKDGKTSTDTLFIRLKGTDTSAFIVNEEPDMQEDKKDEKNNVEENKTILEEILPIQNIEKKVSLDEEASLVYAPAEQMKWLETQGQFKCHTSQDEYFVAKNSSQTAYLTKFGGAVTIGSGGSWQYLIGTQSLDIEEGDMLIDTVIIESEDGVEHKLCVSINDKDGKVFISEVKYTQDGEVDSLTIKSDLENEDIKIKQENSSLDTDILDISQVFDEAEQEFSVEEDLVQKSELMYQIKEEPSVDSDFKETDVNEEAMLSKVQDLMEIKEKERIKTLEKKHQEQVLAEQKEKQEKEESKKNIIGEDEMLLKIQAMMRAPKSIDLDSIEMVNSDILDKKKENKSNKEPIQEIIKQEIKEDVNVHILKGQIKLEEKLSTFKSSFYLEGFELELDGSYIFELNPISYEYLQDNQKELHKVQVYAHKKNGDTLTGFLSIEVKRDKEGFSLSSNQGSFTLLQNKDADKGKEMSIEDLAASGEEFSHHAQEGEPEEGHLAVVFDSLKEGKKLNSDGTLGITIILPKGAQAGEIIMVDGHEFSITGDEADAGKMLYAVYPDDEVEVSYRDRDNNISDSLRAKANENSVEMLEFTLSPELIGEVGSQSMHAGIGIAESFETPWGLMNEEGKRVDFLDSEFARIHIDGETGEIEYRYYEGSGLKKYGRSADDLVCEKFLLTKGKEAYAQLEVNVHIQAESIHGYSGQEIDSSTIKEMKLIKIDKSYQPDIIEKKY